MISARGRRIGLSRVDGAGGCLPFEQIGEIRTNYPQPPLIIIVHGDGTRRSSSEREALRGEAKGGLMREGAGEEEADAPGIAHDDGADLEQTAA